MKQGVRFSYYVESLTLPVWLFCVLPYFLRSRHRQLTAGTAVNEVSLCVYYLYASDVSLLFARLSLKGVGLSLQCLSFSKFDTRDESNEVMWWKTQSKDMPALQQEISNHPEFREITKDPFERRRLSHFLMRHIMSAEFIHPHGLKLPNLLYFIRVVNFFCRSNSGESTANVIFLSSQGTWLSYAAKFVEKQKVGVVFAAPDGLNAKDLILKLLPLKRFVREAFYHGMVFKSRFLHPQRLKPSPHPGPKIAVEHYGHLNLDTPQLHSDLFFCQQSKLLKQDILIYFAHPNLPATEAEWQGINKAGMSAIAIDPLATATAQVPFFKSAPAPQSPKRIRTHTLSSLTGDYQQKFDFWVNFITRQNIKIQVSWYKHDAKEFAMWDALRYVGGAGVVYQRSFESAPSLATVAKADVAFGFSKLGAHVGVDKDSIIPYFVVTGYLGDFRFPLVKQKALHIRELLLKHGVKKIMAYFDENTVDDTRWNIGHNILQENYLYLLNKVLEFQWFGLILKPKVVSNLRRRLGADISRLLDQALATGRCFIFEEGSLFGSHPPAAAALAADIAVHGHFFAATAGVESALAGTKTLMLDREGYAFRSPLYRLGEGKVIFNNWDALWSACWDNWNSSKLMPGFGDWSSMIDEIDPFRDGRAAERMGTYLEWLMEGFKANLPRETILADAAERYTTHWGKDKVLAINV